MLDSKPGSQLNAHNQVNLSFIWVIVNFAGITTGTLVAFFLYTLLTLHYRSDTIDATTLLTRLAACGAIQGFIISGLQSIVLLLNKRELARWLVMNVVSMAAGMAMPSIYVAIAYPALLAGTPFNQYVMAGWILSWMLAGLLGGFTLGKTSLQRIRWGFLNAAAYLYWGLAAAFGMRMLDRALYSASTLADSWIGNCLLIGFLLLLGAWLHSYVFKGIAYQRNRSLEKMEAVAEEALENGWPR